MAEPNKPTNGPATTEAAGAALAEMDQLRAKLAEAEQARDQNLDLAHRTQAEFENYQKRAQREPRRGPALRPGAAGLRHSHASWTISIAPSRRPSRRAKPARWCRAWRWCRRKCSTCSAATASHESKRKGEPFDPNLHQAVMQQPSKDQPPGTVLQVLEHGYRIHDRVLRPARVIVSTAPAGVA